MLTNLPVLYDLSVAMQFHIYLPSVNSPQQSVLIIINSVSNVKVVVVNIKALEGVFCDYTASNFAKVLLKLYSTH